MRDSTLEFSWEKDVASHVLKSCEVLADNHRSGSPPAAEFQQRIFKRTSPEDLSEQD
jgi:hypothetical protein